MFNTYAVIKIHLLYLLICFPLLGIFHITFAQERIITGKVTDKKTGIPLISCSVYALNSGNWVITDEKGKYTFTRRDKTDSIAISMIGYKSVSKAVFYQSEDGIRDWSVTGVQTCALPI